MRGLVPDRLVPFHHLGFDYKVDYEETCDRGEQDPWRIRVYVSRSNQNSLTEERMLLIWVKDGRQNSANLPRIDIGLDGASRILTHLKFGPPADQISFPPYI